MKSFLTYLIMCFAAVFVLKAERADTTIYFVNIYAGPEIFELDGHSAILVDIKGQPAQSYNFGVFDFHAPNFVWRFVKGETDYMAVEWPWELFVNGYQRQGRRMMAHELNFDSEQKAKLISALKENVKPENAVYRYNYVKDNCATRPLRAVEYAAGDSIILAPAPFEAQSFMPMTFRNIMRAHHANYPWYQFGIDLALGSGIDYPLQRREVSFAPVELDGMLAGATVGNNKLVSRSFAIIDTPANIAIESPTPWYLTPIFVCCTVFVLTALICLRDIRRKCISRWYQALYFSIIGLAGCLLTFLIFVSVHEATSPNWLYMWVNPAAMLVPCLIWLKKGRIFLFYYQIVNFAVLFAMSICWYWIPQSGNYAFIPLIGSEMFLSASYIYITKHTSKKS